MSRGIRTGLGAVVALVAAAAGIYIASGTAGGPIKPYTLGETLPKMVADFGAQARVVQISYSADNVDFQVIPRDGRLHIRNYDVVESEIDAGTTGYNRKVTDVVRAPTAAEAAHARVTLGQIEPGVVDRLLHKVGFARHDSSAIFSGASWLLETYKGPSDDYVASFDGSGVHHGNPATTATTATTATVTTVRTTQAAPAGASNVSTFSTTFTVTENPRASKLLRCIVSAQGDVHKVLKCQQRFPP